MFRKAGVVKPRLFACLREFLKCLFQGAEIIVAQKRPQPFKFIFRQFINPHLQKAFYDCIIKSFPQGMRRISSCHFIRGNVFGNDAADQYLFISIFSDTAVRFAKIPAVASNRMPLPRPCVRRRRTKPLFWKRQLPERWNKRSDSRFLCCFCKNLP